MTMPHFPDHPTLEIVLYSAGGGHYSLLRLPHRPGVRAHGGLEGDR